jgi:hypothetical protein
MSGLLGTGIRAVGNPQAVSRLFRRNPVAGLSAGAAGLGLLAAAGSVADASILYSNQGEYAAGFQEPILFPSDLFRNGDNEIPFISMQFEQYQRRSINEQPFYSEKMKIRLPLPANLTEQTSLDYPTQELGSAAGAVVESLAGSGSGGIEGLRNSIGQRLGTAVSGIGVSALRTIASEISPRGAGLSESALSVLSGISANPFQVILFKSPKFRSHRFSWKFIPNSLAESEELRKLVNTFKYHALPGISQFGSVFFSYPEILKVNFQPSDRYLYKLKPCVVTNVTVNYAPNGPSFVRESKAPTAIDFEIQLQEIEIMTKADFLRDNRGIFTTPSSSPRNDAARSASAAANPLVGSNPNGAE